jgi:hypothetical protein
LAGIKGRSGRKSKAEEQELIEKLSVYDDDAFRILGEKIRQGEYWAVRTYMAYRWGKPKEVQDINLHTTQIETPIINWKKTDNE